MRSGLRRSRQSRDGGPHQPDEFDVEGFASHRRGAHRARPGVVARWAPTVLALAAVVALVTLVTAAVVLFGVQGVLDLAARLWDAATSALSGLLPAG